MVDKKKWMTVHEMGDLLGLKKTARYWIVKKNYFKTDTIQGKMYVDIESFEKWYAGQSEYRKVTGESPGEELKKESYSVHEIAEILKIKPERVYAHMRNSNIPFIIVKERKRFLRTAFEEWYQNQKKLLDQKDREKWKNQLEASMSMPEVARALGVTRQTVYNIIGKKDSLLKTVEIAGKKRVMKSDFLDWYRKQTVYKMVDVEAEEEDENSDLQKYRMARTMKEGTSKYNGNQFYLTVDEASYLAQVSHQMISKWIKAGYFPVLRYQRSIKIMRFEFEEWLEERKKKDGIDS